MKTRILQGRYCVNLFVIIITSINAIALLSIFCHPLEPLPWQWADDALYFNSSLEITKQLGGFPWLGIFDELTISKAPGFPVFLSVIHLLGIPLRIAEYLLYAALPFIFCMALKPLDISNKALVFLATVFLVFIPVAGVDSRLVRTCLFGALSIYCLLFLLGLISRSILDMGRAWIWSVGVGLFFGFSMCTREDGSWLIIPIIFSFLLIIFCFKKSVNIKKLMLNYFLLVVTTFIPITIVSTLNFLSYDIYAVSLRQCSEFRDLYAILSSLEPNKKQQFVPITTETRYATYKISDNFKKLKPFIEGPSTDALAKNKAHHKLNKFSKSDREFFVSNFEFALAKAIVSAGFNSGLKFKSFCKITAQEIKNAINRDEIEAGSKGFAMLPPVTISNAEDILLSSYKSLEYLLKGQGQQRPKYMVRRPQHPDYGEVIKWHAFLQSAPYPSKELENSSNLNGTQLKVTNNPIIYNVVTSNTIADRILELWILLNRYIFPILIAGAGIVMLLSYSNNSENLKSLIIMLITSWSAIISFSLTRGIIDTIAFPILQYAGGYNKMGFFPLHVIVLVSATTIFYAFKNLIKS